MLSYFKVAGSIVHCESTATGSHASGPVIALLTITVGDIATAKGQLTMEGCGPLGKTLLHSNTTFSLDIQYGVNLI